MKIYLVILNWVLLMSLLTVIALGILGGGWTLPVGMFIGSMATAGLISYQYSKDESPDKDWKWRKGYFHKDYPVETLVHLFLGTLCFVISYWFWRGFWLMGLGFCLAWLINILVEWAWAKWHNYYNYYNNK